MFSFAVKITPPNHSDLLIQSLQNNISSLQSEVAFLREQVKTLSERNAPAPLPTRVQSVPMKYDPIRKDYVPKTPEELEADRQGLKELGII